MPALPKILLFGGTSEGRELAASLAELAWPALVSVTESYGAKLLDPVLQAWPQAPLEIHQGALEEEAIEELLREKEIGLLIDAAHPFAARLHANAAAAAARQGLPLWRIIRESTGIGEPPQGLPESARERSFASLDELLTALLQEDSSRYSSIYSTLGVKEAAQLTRLPDFASRLYLRILPLTRNLQTVLDAGYLPAHVCCMQGPFSEAINRAMFQDSGAELVLSKESGPSGGFPEKRAAAAALGLAFWWIRPPRAEGELATTEGQARASARRELSLEEATAELQQMAALPALPQPLQPSATSTGKESAALAEATQSPAPASAKAIELPQKAEVQHPRLTIVGFGMSAAQLSAEASQAIAAASQLYGAPRLLEEVRSISAYHGQPLIPAYTEKELRPLLQALPADATAVLLVSGDSGFYSAAAGLSQKLAAFQPRCLPGISSPSAFFAKLGQPWQDVLLLSAHGQDLPLVAAVRRHPKVCLLLGNNLATLCQRLTDYGFGDLPAILGENIDRPGERIRRARVVDFLTTEAATLALLCIENPQADGRALCGIPDAAFQRGPRPMSKAATRALLLHTLAPHPRDILWDVGAGSGACSVELALAAYAGQVFAVDEAAEAGPLIEANARRFHLANIHFCRGHAPQALETLPDPDAVFIGGSGAALPAILEAAMARPSCCRIVLTAITVETVSSVLQDVQQRTGWTAETVQLQLSRSHPAGGKHMILAENPVFLITLQRQEVEE